MLWRLMMAICNKAKTGVTEIKTKIVLADDVLAF